MFNPVPAGGKDLFCRGIWPCQEPFSGSMIVSGGVTISTVPPFVTQLSSKPRPQVLTEEHTNSIQQTNTPKITITHPKHDTTAPQPLNRLQCTYPICHQKLPPTPPQGRPRTPPRGETSGAPGSGHASKRDLIHESMNRYMYVSYIHIYKYIYIIIYIYKQFYL